jgi:hypothetical protein
MFPHRWVGRLGPTHLAKQLQTALSLTEASTDENRVTWPGSGSSESTASAYFSDDGDIDQNLIALGGVAASQRAAQFRGRPP